MKECKVCATKFEPRSSWQSVCSPKCAYKIPQVIKKAEANKIKERKEAIKTKSEWTKEAQKAFNAFIRERDKHKPCISCGQPLKIGGVGGGFDCGHYRSVGSAPHLRFNEFNAHGQCKKCNRYGSGMAVDYRIGLIKREGLAIVEHLEWDNRAKHYIIEDLKDIKKLYTSKTKELKKAIE